MAGTDAAVANEALEENAPPAGSACAATVSVSVLEVRSCLRGEDGELGLSNSIERESARGARAASGYGGVRERARDTSSALDVTAGGSSAITRVSGVEAPERDSLYAKRLRRPPTLASSLTGGESGTLGRSNLASAIAARLPPRDEMGSAPRRRESCSGRAGAAGVNTVAVGSADVAVLGPAVTASSLTETAFADVAIHPTDDGHCTPDAGLKGVGFTTYGGGGGAVVALEAAATGAVGG